MLRVLSSVKKLYSFSIDQENVNNHEMKECKTRV